MKILIVAPFTLLPSEAGFNRFSYLAEMLSNDGNDVVLLTSSFRHFDKKKRLQTTYDCNYKIVLLDEPGYKSNISLSRLWSHKVFINRFEDWLKLNGKNFNMIYSAYPLIGTNTLLIKYKNIFNYKHIVDIQDVWPEAISSAYPFIKKIPIKYLPFSESANEVYENSDAVVAVSKTYLNRAKINNKILKSNVTYIGSDMSKIQESIPISLDKDYIHCVYVGMIGRSYDIATLIEAFSLVEEDNKKIMLHILGEGPDRKKLEKRIHKNIRFHGLLKYSEMISFVKSCDYLMNPIHSYAPQSVTNKLSDYILLGKPIINSQECAEVSDIINVDGNYFYKSGNVFALVNILNKLIKAPPNINYSSEVLKDFDRSYSYENLKEFIKSV